VLFYFLFCGLHTVSFTQKTQEGINMKTKRFAALALALTMAMGTFTGCSGNNS